MKGQEVSNAPAVRLPELDGLRAIAIMLVLFMHELGGVPVAWVRWISEKGWVGVDLFFVLSGFLIGGILLDQRRTANYYRVFYWRRFLRIVPLYAVLVLPGLIIVGTGLRSHFGGHSLANQSVMGMWLCVCFVQNCCWLFGLDLPNYLTPTWSVAVEEQFYLLMPPLIRNLEPGKLLRILVLAIVAAPLLRGAMFVAWGDDAARSRYALLPCRWDSLLLGVLLAFAYRDAKFAPWVASRLRSLQIFWWLSLLGALAFLFSTRGRLDPHLGFLGYTMIDVCCACTLLLAVMHPAGHLHRVLSLPCFKPIATVSYALYLLHSPALAIVESVFHFAHFDCPRISWAETGLALLSLILAIFAAAVSWRFFESRLIRLGHRRQYQSAPSG